MLSINFHPFPILETERLVLRNLRENDVQEMLDIRGNPVTMQYISRPLAKNLDDAAGVIKMITGFTERNERINWAITEKGADKFIGMVGYVTFKPESYRAEVGYVMNDKYLRRGICYEALQAVLDYGFHTMKLHSIEAIVRPENIPSIQLLEKAGFVREGYFRDYIFHHDGFRDAIIYSLLKPA